MEIIEGTNYDWNCGWFYLQPHERAKAGLSVKHSPERGPVELSQEEKIGPTAPFYTNYAFHHITFCADCARKMGWIW